MKEMQFEFGNVKVKVIDKSSHEARRKRLEEPLKIFWKEVENERKNRRFNIHNIS